MAVYAITSSSFVLNSVDYSDHIKAVTINVDVASLDTTDMASSGWNEFIGGLKSYTVTVEFMDDVADNDVDEELWALLGTVTTWTSKPASGSVSASNPQYSGSVLVTTHTLGGSVGELAGKSLTFQGSGALARAVA